MLNYLISLKFKLLFLSLTFTLGISLFTKAQAQEEGVLIRGGYLKQRIKVETGYGEFLNERYGVEELNPQGLLLGVGYMFGVFGVGYEQSEIADEFTYETLNGENETGKVAISQSLLTLHYLISESIGSAFGIGTNQLTRNIAGYQDVTIVTTNVSRNGGVAEVETSGSAWMAELSYKFLEPSFTPEIGLRYTSSVHSISSNDERPAIDNRGDVVNSDFDLSGIALMINFTFIL